MKVVCDWRDLTEDLEQQSFEYGLMIEHKGKKYWVQYDEDGAWIVWSSIWQASREIMDNYLWNESTEEEMDWLQAEIDFLRTQHDFV